MEIILKQDFKGLGYKNELIKVKPGYARNYLIPKQFAVVANESNKKIALENIRQSAHKLAKKKKEAESIAAKLDQLTIEVRAKVGEKSKIFGTVTSLQLADALKAQGIFIDRKDINFETPIKTLGIHQARATLHKDVTHSFSFEVVAK